MMRRTMTTIAAVAMLLVAAFGGTALAQDVTIGDDGISQPNPEGFTDDQCAAAIAAYYLANFPDSDQVGDLEGLEGEDLTDEVEQLLIDLTPEDEEDDLTFNDICAIYSALPDPPDVAGEVEEAEEDQDRDPAPDREPGTDVAGEDEEVTPEVMGVTIAHTGADTVVLGIIGAVLMVLGVLAVRRTRTEHGVS